MPVPTPLARCVRPADRCSPRRNSRPRFPWASPRTPYWTLEGSWFKVNDMSKLNEKTDDVSPVQMSFEEAMEKLESIVEAMESGELPLETLMSRFEEGTRLTKYCEKKLAEADLKIQKLEANEDGKLGVEPMSGESDTESPSE